MHLRRTLPIVVLGLALSAVNVASAGTIKKCKDADGKWHYGDFAAEECAKSKITEIDKQGLKVKEQLAPPTEAELEARREAQERQQQAAREAEARMKERERISKSYSSEEAITRQKDNQVQALDQAIDTDQKLKARLGARLGKLTATLAPPAELESVKGQIADYDAAIAAKQSKRAAIIKRFDEELALYRELVIGGKETAAQ